MSSATTTSARLQEPENLKTQKQKVRSMRVRIRDYETNGHLHTARHLRSLLDYEMQHLWRLQAEWERSRDGC
jgi:hypothetical protein